MSPAIFCLQTKHSTHSLPAVWLEEEALCMEWRVSVEAYLACLPLLNSERIDRLWQTLWSTSVSIRSSQYKKKKKKRVLDVSCLFEAVTEMWGLHLETCLWRLFITRHLPAIGHSWQWPRVLQICSDIVYSFLQKPAGLPHLHITLLMKRSHLSISLIARFESNPLI